MPVEKADALAVRQAAGVQQRKEFGATQITRQAETATTAAAAAATAAIQARTIMALQRPRDWDDVRSRVLEQCRHPEFARIGDPKNPNPGGAIYRKPVGGGSVTGLSIRFVEAALRDMGNVSTRVMPIFDDEDQRIYEVTVSDLETNLTQTECFTIRKTVQRKKPIPGRELVGQRPNSYGDMLYEYRAAGEDELVDRINAMTSKAIRRLGLRVIPGWLQTEARAVLEQTQHDQTAKDPAAARKAIADGFARINVKPSDLKRYLGVQLDQASPAQLDELRGIWAAIADGETSWAEVLEQKLEEGGEDADDEQRSASQAERIAARQKAREEAAPPPATAKPKPKAKRKSTGKASRSSAKPEAPPAATEPPQQELPGAATDKPPGWDEEPYGCEGCGGPITSGKLCEACEMG